MFEVKPLTCVGFLQYWKTKSELVHFTVDYHSVCFQKFATVINQHLKFLFNLSCVLPPMGTQVVLKVAKVGQTKKKTKHEG